MVVHVGWHKNMGTICFVLSQIMRVTDGRTDGWAAFLWLFRASHYMQLHVKNTI